MKKKLLITGGSGTVGSAFISRYYDSYDIAVFSRNESLQADLKRKFVDVECFLGSIENKSSVFAAYDVFQPSIVIHAAAMKHVNLAEKQPIQTCDINILGSLNVIEASRLFRTPITVAVSTDKACDIENVYGASKYMMERCFLEANSPTQSFVVCRFANVAHSNGSVIPFWLKLASEGKSLKVTDPSMNRMMFSQKEAADLIHKAIDFSLINKNGFILTKLMKNVNILKLAKAISNQIEIVGARLGEKVNENLVSLRELPYSKILDNGYILIQKDKNDDISTTLKEPFSTETAESMSDEEIRNLVFQKE